VALASAIGIPVGIAGGYYSGKTDEILMRGMDLLMTFPPIILALLLLIILAPSMSSAVIAIGIVFAPRIARVARSSTLAIRDSEYIQACEQRDESSLYIMFYEILPNIKGPIIIEATIRIGFAIMIGAALSFLGLGVQPPTPDWGNMISEARNEIQNSIWMLVWPSLSLSATILGFNLLGDGLGDVLNDELSEED
jgi:peptide/nickel transport system permease protein